MLRTFRHLPHSTGKYGLGRPRTTHVRQAAEKYVAADLHTDGGAAFAAQLGDIRRNQSFGGDNDSVPYLISDEAVTEGLITGLLTLARHARDRAAAGGNVLARESIESLRLWARAQ